MDSFHLITLEIWKACNIKDPLMSLKCKDIYLGVEFTKTLLIKFSLGTTLFIVSYLYATANITGIILDKG